MSVLHVLALSTLASLVLQLLRQLWTGEGRFWAIAWDLFLAWLPLAFAVALVSLIRRGAGTRPTRASFLLLWFLFFPNAPYLITEFVHLGVRTANERVWWCDLVVIQLIAWTGMILGFASVYLIQQLIERRRGRMVGWLFASATLAIGSFGITLGRFQRLNSWDALVNPQTLLAGFRKLATPHTFHLSLGLAGLLTVFLLICYATLSVLLAVGDESITRRDPA